MLEIVVKDDLCAQFLNEFAYVCKMRVNIWDTFANLYFKWVNLLTEDPQQTPKLQEGLEWVTLLMEELVNALVNTDAYNEINPGLIMKIVMFYKSVSKKFKK